MESEQGLAIKTNDNLDNRSVCSSVASSMKNAELIMAAFSTQPITLTIEEENENLEEMRIKSSDVSLSQTSLSSDTIDKVSKNSEKSSPNKNLSNDDLEIVSHNNSAELTIDEEPANCEYKSDIQNSSFDNTKAPQQYNEFNLNDPLDETIANVASGSISKATKKAVANKQKLTIRETKSQQKIFYKMKKIRENEQKKKAIKRLERIKKLERDRAIKKQQKEAREKKKLKGKKSLNNSVHEDSNEIKKKRYRRTKLELLRENQLIKFNSEIDKSGTKPSKLSLKQMKSLQNEDSTDSAKFLGRNKLKSVKKIDADLKKRKTKVNQDVKPVPGKRGRKKKQVPIEKAESNPEDSELIFEPSTNNYLGNEFESESEPGEDEESESKHTNQNISFKRQCLVCKRKMHQDKLNDHCSNHYYESAKCSDCDKVSTNPSNYVTHLLSHLPSQFYCNKCDKWFRQPIVYRRHQKECTVIPSTNKNLNTSLKRKATLENLPETSALEQQETKRTRRNRNTETVALEPEPIKVQIKNEPVVVKRKQGRPRKDSLAVPNPNFKSEIKPISSYKNKVKKEPSIQNIEETETEEDSTRKSLRPRNTLKKAKSEETKTCVSYEKPTRKKSDRLSSMSSAVSSTSSSNSQKQTKKTGKYALDESPINSNEIDDNISDRMNDIDDIVVSDYEMDDEINNNEENSNKTAEDSKNLRSNDVKNEVLINKSNLSSCATYKVKIQLRRPSNNLNTPQSKHKENDSSSVHSIKEIAQATPQTPSKLLNSMFILNEQPSVIKFQGTPSKADLASTNPVNNPSIMASGSHTFECPECDKKFVSYYGLFQHYDQHPNLAVSCSQCQISFENHQALCVHNTKVHPNFLMQFNEFKSKNQQALKKSDSTKSTSNGRPQGSAKQSLNFQNKSKSQNNDLIETAPVNNPNDNDLSALPSIMTRTSRLTNGNTDKNGMNSVSNTASNKTTVAISNHKLTFKTTGFADLSFIDFSCLNFPRIAQNYCELWPRKLPTNSDIFQQQMQPLHNYSCEQCKFYFPCKSSLELHKKKKEFANSKLVIKETGTDSCQDNKLEQSRCKLFMTNSKYLCYEKCLDEIIGKIETKSDKMSKSKFLRLFGLIEKSSLPLSKSNYYSTTAFMSNSSGKAKSLNESLIKYVSPIPVIPNIVEGMLLSVRKQLLEINSQFIIDLDRWKLIHSSDSSFLSDKIDFDASKYSSKIHLKPHVNLNRPLLIRSKKLKRNSQKNLTSGKNMHVASPRQQPFRSAQLVPTINSINEKLISVASNNKAQPQITPIASKLPVKIATNSKNATANMPKLSKPYFTATSGNFSASNCNAKNKNAVTNVDNKASNNQMNKKRKLEMQKKQAQEKQKKVKEHKNKKMKQQSSPVEFPTFEGVDSDQFEDNDIIMLNETEDDDDYDYYDADEKDNKFQSNIKFTKPEKPMNGNSNAKNPASFSSGMDMSQKSEMKSKLPQPPTLYKAPQNNINTTIFTSAANSSILANASGMNNNLVKKNMPKLLPANKIGSSSTSSSLNSSRTSNQSELALMPKLKPVSSSQQRNTNRVAPSKPPQLIKTGVKPEQKNSPIQNQTQQISKANGKQQSQQQQNANSIFTNQTMSTSKPVSKNSKNNAKNSENLSLKCKFCFQIFEGQPEFFQHVIKSHPKMLEQRLNRSNSSSSVINNKPATNASAKTNAKTSRVSSSNGNSNHSSVSTASNSSTQRDSNKK